jgi:hypothetical protein
MLYNPEAGVTSNNFKNYDVDSLLNLVCKENLKLKYKFGMIEDKNSVMKSKTLHYTRNLPRTRTRHILLH